MNALPSCVTVSRTDPCLEQCLQAQVANTQAVCTHEFLQCGNTAGTCSRWFLARGFSTLKMEAIRSSETSVHIRSTRPQIPEDGILRSYRHENLKSYKAIDVAYWFCLSFPIINWIFKDVAPLLSMFLSPFITNPDKFQMIPLLFCALLEHDLEMTLQTLIFHKVGEL
jgi:hypothetical protein